METYLSSVGYDVWMSVKNGYTVPTTPTNLDAKREYEHNTKAKHAILSGLSDIEFVKVTHYTFAKETWDKLQRIYEGDAKVKEAKLQHLRAQFESLKMKDEENIVDYLQRVDETVNAVRGLGENIEDEVIVKKVPRSLTTKYDTKVSAIEEAKDLKTFSMDELFGSLFAYEMRTISVEPSKKEVFFTSENKGKETAICVDDVEANFVRKLKKGSSKYRGNLRFKCFDCGKIRHFADKCPYKKKEDNNEGDVKDTSKKFYNPTRRNFQK
ncbi:uncharacterized protein LOC131860394 [Cryptomeria japonica]|uniref:uncharacterized protein LOC131860394 n=1 Tax=Cryptomeria japonica TaxID=3369 RepID=UPI0027D9ECA3|nr:uncharacterized protein LOC131860394 [Cryptomeria japonica]